MFPSEVMQSMISKAGNQNRLAKVAGVSRSTVNNWVKGRKNPSVAILVRLEQLGFVDLKAVKPDLFY